MRGQDRYEPKSDFLRSVIADEIPFEAGEFGEHNLQRLIALTSDQDRSNRDWATMLLVHLELDRPDVRKALITAAGDEDMYVRGEAILGLIDIDPILGLKLVRRELKAEFVAAAVFEAAERLADPSLIDDLEHFQWESEKKVMDGLASDALQACMKTKAEGKT